MNTFFSPSLIQDAELLRKSFRCPLGSENFLQDTYLNQLILKPWGHEYRIYIDNIYDIWMLRINPDKRTSIHCHPRKDTVLLCLAGHGVFWTRERTQFVATGSQLFIRRGEFHSTYNIGESGLDLIEVEAPRNKFDLVRLDDDHGRANTAYESVSECAFTLPPMLPVDNGPDAWYRTDDLEGRYKFSIGKRLSANDDEYRLFSINISLEAFFRNTIEIVGNGENLADDGLNSSMLLSVHAHRTA
jgi:mannose-6-phosphate isomerase-like protein (cupin superfamily)